VAIDEEVAIRTRADDLIRAHWPTRSRFFIKICLYELILLPNLVASNLTAVKHVKGMRVDWREGEA
jgi:hypothetical protein